MREIQADDPKGSSCCGACTRAGRRCGQLAMANGRCRYHGGLSTGPRTTEGLARMRAAKTVHGGRSADTLALLRAMRDLQRSVLTIPIE